MTINGDQQDPQPEVNPLGLTRLQDFIDANGMLAGNQMALTLSMGFAASVGYSDEALAQIEKDCDDLVQSANDLAGLAWRIRGEWREQRIADEAK